MNEVRLKKVGSLLRELVSKLIMSGDVKDPRVTTMLSITKVDVAKDLTTARLYISSFMSDESVQEGVKGLNKAAGYIQKSISKRLKMRVTPRLKFYADNSLREGFEVSQKLKKLVETEEQ